MPVERLVRGGFLSFHALAPEIVFGCHSVVGSTAQGKVRRRVLAATSEGREVVKLQATCFGATPARVVHVGAALVVARRYGTSDRRGDMPRVPALARVLASLGRARVLFPRGIA